MPAIEERDLHGWGAAHDSAVCKDDVSPAGGWQWEVIGCQIRQPLTPDYLQFISSNPNESYSYMENYWRVEGLDENGKEIYEDFTPNGRTPVPGLKKFSYIRRIVPWDTYTDPSLYDEGCWIYGSDGGFETVTPAWSGACQGGTPRTVILGADASPVDNYYAGMMCRFTSGTLAGQIGRVANYAGATKTLTISERMGAPFSWMGIAGCDLTTQGGWGSGQYDDELKYLGTPVAGDLVRVSPGWTMGNDTFSTYYEPFYKVKSPFSGTKTVYTKIYTEIWAGPVVTGDVTLVLDDPSGRIEWAADYTPTYDAWTPNRLTEPVGAVWTRDPLVIRYDDNCNGTWLRITLNAKEKLNLRFSIHPQGIKN